MYLTLSSSSFYSIYIPLYVSHSFFLLLFYLFSSSSFYSIYMPLYVSHSSFSLVQYVWRLLAVEVCMARSHTVFFLVSGMAGLLGMGSLLFVLDETFFIMRETTLDNVSALRMMSLT